MKTNGIIMKKYGTGVILVDMSALEVLLYLHLQEYF